MAGPRGPPYFFPKGPPPMAGLKGPAYFLVLSTFTKSPSFMPRTEL